MKYCKKCGVLYTTDVCPKCGVLMPAEEAPQQADPKQVKRQWIGLLIGIPCAILLILSVITLFHTFVN